MNQGEKIILQIASVMLFSTVLALTFNAFRGEGLPLVMPFPPEYQCPSRMSQGVAIKVEEALSRHGRGKTLLVDARSETSFDRGHIEGALSLPYSFLDPVPADVVARLRKAGGIIVYCNTKHAERSRLLAGELSDAGLKGVSYLEGGFLEWVKARGPYTGQKPEDYE